MKINFFEALAALKVEGDWQITIKAGKHNLMLVSVLFTNDNVSDDAKKLIPPMLLKGTVAELDEGFFASIETPVKQTASLFVNMEAYVKAQDEAQRESRIGQDKQQQQKKAKDASRKKYEAQMEKVAELEKEGKYREAYAQLPKPESCPGYEDQIKEKRKELSEKFEQPNLF